MTNNFAYIEAEKYSSFYNIKLKILNNYNNRVLTTTWSIELGYSILLYITINYLCDFILHRFLSHVLKAAYLMTSSAFYATLIARNLFSENLIRKALIIILFHILFRSVWAKLPSGSLVRNDLVFLALLQNGCAVQQLEFDKPERRILGKCWLIGIIVVTCHFKRILGAFRIFACVWNY